MNTFDWIDFVNFVMEQPEEKPINHTTSRRPGDSAWTNCAVGEYFTHVTGQRLTVHTSESLIDELHGALLAGDAQIYELLNCSAPDTYGELQTYLQDPAAKQAAYRVLCE